ncbi:MAG: hypothetical protein JKX85_06255 [Phycisphaeraceae bacterium]|nr:hypothetical protein [Phycisphaeraceae bacterium]
MELKGPPAVPVQRVQTNYTTAMAVQQPRELVRVEQSSIQESEMIGSDGFYAWGVGKDRIEGPSKDLAMTLVRCWGNCAIDLGEIQDLPDSWIFTATFIDLETGFTLARQFRQSKSWTIYGKMDAARKEDIRFQIGQSKAVRNVVLNVLPKWLVRRAMDACKGGVREKIEKAVDKHGMDVVITRSMERLQRLGVDEHRLLTAMGRKALPALTIEDMVIIHGSIAALESGADTIDAVFPMQKSDVIDDGKSKTESLTSRLTGKPVVADGTSEPRQQDAGAAEPIADQPVTHDTAAPSPLDQMIDHAVASLDGTQGAIKRRLLDYARQAFGVNSLSELNPDQLSAMHGMIDEGNI